VNIALNPRSIADYETFLRVKSLPVYKITGRSAWFPDEYASRLGITADTSREIEPETHPDAFDYQAAITRLAIQKRRFAIFARCGLGKTLMLLDFARHAHKAAPKKRILIISPLMVVDQTAAEHKRFYGSDIEIVPSSKLTAWLAKSKGAIGITNYEALREDVPQANLGGLILDECFAAGTMVDCVVNGISIPKPIENVLCGDKILNAAGVDTAIRTHKREVKRAYIVNAGTKITCSENHPFFTQRGWVGAQDLEPGDSVLTSRAAVRNVRGSVQAEGYMGIGEVLRQVLLSEMENEPAEVPCGGSQSESQCEAGRSEAEVVRSGKSESRSGAEADRGIESYVESEGASQGIKDTKGHAARSFRAWWQWEGDDFTAEAYAGCSWTDLEGGIRFVVGPANGGLSNALQARFGKRRNESRYRGGWVLPSLAQDARRQENGEAEFVRVESLEVLEPGHPELERLREADGKLYFYDIEAERHPSFSVSGLLVHNSSMLKSHYGKYGQECIRLGAGIEWKLALTGTPAPNDRIEFGNHAVFLDQFPNVNSFLARYFVNRGQTQERWELRPHAVQPFFRSLSHWCLFLNNPAIYGWKDNCNTLPPINVHIHDVDLTAEQSRLIRGETGQLFTTDLGGIVSRQKLARISKGDDSLKPEFIRNLAESLSKRSGIIWCKYNDEQDGLARMFPDAANIDGSTPHAERLELIADFKAGRRKQLISKPKILGFGLNLQIAKWMIFSTLQDSYEEYWQAVARANRIGSTEPLEVHIPLTEVERPMVDNVLRKAKRIEADTELQERMFRDATIAT